MTFTSPTTTIQSTLTHQGRDLLARSTLGQLSFRLSGFKVGRDGYDAGNPVHALLVDPAATDLGDPIFPIGSGVHPFIAIETPLNTVTAAVCRLARLDATYGLGEVGLFARVMQIGTYASYQHIVASTNGLVFTAKSPGAAGNAVQVELVAASPNQTLAVSTVGTAITVTLATDGSSVVTSTLAHVANAIRTDPSANTIVACAAYGDTSTICTSLALTSLTGGTTPSTPYVVGSDYLFAIAHMPLTGKTDQTVMVFRFIIAA